MDPKIDPKSIQNRSEIDILYKSGFDFVSRSIFDHFFDNQSKPLTQKMLKKTNGFSYFLHIQQSTILKEVAFKFSFNLVCFWLQKSTKIVSQTYQNQHRFLERFLVQFLVRFWLHFGTNLGTDFRKFRRISGHSPEISGISGSISGFSGLEAIGHTPGAGPDPAGLRKFREISTGTDFGPQKGPQNRSKIH